MAYQDHGGASTNAIHNEDQRLYQQQIDIIQVQRIQKQVDVR